MLYRKGLEKVPRLGIVLVAAALAAAGCQSMGRADLGDGETAYASTGDPAGWSLFGRNPAQSDVDLAKRHFRENNYGLAERHFRRAVESRPDDAEAWLGLGASYDQLRRFDLADRAYSQAIGLTGRTPEVLNNQGYSYLMRGEYEKARAILLEAQSLDPHNPYVKNNLALLDAT